MNQYFEARRAQAVRQLAEKGVPRWKVVPAFYRFVWARGVRLRPPHFASWEANFLLFGGGAGAIAALGVWLAVTATEGEMPLVRAMATGTVLALVYGFSQAARYKREAEDHGLPAWDELPGVAEAFD
jgi:uncharacterized protein DUF6404